MADGARHDHRSVMSQAKTPAPGAPEENQAPVEISCSPGIADWLVANAVSLGFTSYQSGRLYLVGATGAGRLSFHERHLARAMGLWADPQRLLVATLFQLWRFENILAPGERTAEGADRHYMPRVAHTTGDIDIHEIGVTSDGRVVFVNTLYSCLAELSPTHSFKPIWKPPFISSLAPEDRCHMNGLGMRDGEPHYVTMVSQTDVAGGWRRDRSTGGSLIDVTTNEIITDKLSMPHSPRWRDGELWLLNSGSGHLGTVDLATGAFEPRIFCPGFLRGFAFHNNHAIVGLSLPRGGNFSGLALDRELGARKLEPWCGVQVIDLASGAVVEWIRLQGGVSELFDVSVLPGVRHATATGLVTEDIQKIVSIDGWGSLASLGAEPKPSIVNRQPAGIGLQ